MNNLQLCLIFVILLLTVSCTSSVQEIDQVESPLLVHTVYIPHVEYIQTCFDDHKSVEFAGKLISDYRQHRIELRCNEELVEAAKKRAYSLSKLDYFAHCDLDGVCPNVYARDAGCELPSHYGDGNNIESLGAGTASLSHMYNALLNSPDHRMHLMGENDFFRQQTDLGIAFLFDLNSRYKFYWVILIAICVDEIGE